MGKKNRLAEPANANRSHTPAFQGHGRPPTHLLARRRQSLWHVLGLLRPHRRTLLQWRKPGLLAKRPTHLRITDAAFFSIFRPTSTEPKSRNTPVPTFSSAQKIAHSNTHTPAPFRPRHALQHYLGCSSGGIDFCLTH